MISSKVQLQYPIVVGTIWCACSKSTIVGFVVDSVVGSTVGSTVDAGVGAEGSCTMA